MRHDMFQTARDYNPFTNIDLHIPSAFYDDVKRYTTTPSKTGKGSKELTPYNRYVDLWIAAVAIGAQLNLFTTDMEQHTFIRGAVLKGEHERIEFLQLVAISRTKDPKIVSEPLRVIEIADAYAAGGLPMLLEWLDGGIKTPMMSLTSNMIDFLEDVAGDALMGSRTRHDTTPLGEGEAD